MATFTCPRLGMFLPIDGLATVLPIRLYRYFTDRSCKYTELAHNHIDLDVLLDLHKATFKEMIWGLMESIFLYRTANLRFKSIHYTETVTILNTFFTKDIRIIQRALISALVLLQLFET
ncbi:hypothetical protein SUGI_0124580 [Cryptomeria japonica]|nr:hypothetical protein SUGI_0124580 [Cryptomeria japonica]